MAEKQNSDNNLQTTCKQPENSLKTAAVFRLFAGFYVKPLKKKRKL